MNWDVCVEQLAAELSAEQRKRTVDSLTSPDDALEALKQFFTVRWPATKQRPMLIVLDDVSDSEVVGKLVPRDVLPSGSAVLMTYRDDNVGRSVCLRGIRATLAYSAERGANSARQRARRANFAVGALRG